MELSQKEIARYSRHLILPDVGMKGQKALKAAKVLVVGAGGLGCPIGLYLAAAGVGTIGLVDFDVVDESNLQRQVLYTSEDVGVPKILAAKRRLEGLNAYVKVVPHEAALSSANALDIAEGYDMVVDGTDNFATRYLVNDLCVLLGKPNVYGSIFRFEGQVSIFGYPGGPCYRCLYPEPPPPGLVPSCAEGGVLGVLPGVVGCLQANEAIKLICGIGEPLVGRLLRFDALAMKFYELRLRRDPHCVICGDRPSQTELIDYHQFCGVPKPGTASVEPKKEERTDMGFQVIDVLELRRRLDEERDTFVLIDVREEHEWEIANIEGARLIPLSTLQDNLGEFEPETHYVIHCKMGGRSARACEFLISQGITRVTNVAGGIDQWAVKVDPSVPRY